MGRMIVEIMLAGGMIGATAAAITLAVQRARDAANVADTGARLTLAQFEIEKLTQALDAERQRTKALGELINANPNEDLDRSDVATRLARFGVSKEWDGQAGDPTRPHHPADAVPDAPDTGAPDAVPLPGEHPTVR